MSGKRYLLDTNAIVLLLQGSRALVTLLQNAEWVAISVINQIEFLAFSELNESDRHFLSNNCTGRRFNPK